MKVTEFSPTIFEPQRVGQLTSRNFRIGAGLSVLAAGALGGGIAAGTAAPDPGGRRVQQGALLGAGALGLAATIGARGRARVLGAALLAGTASYGLVSAHQRGNAVDVEVDPVTYPQRIAWGARVPASPDRETFSAYMLTSLAAALLGTSARMIPVPAAGRAGLVAAAGIAGAAAGAFLSDSDAIVRAMLGEPGTANWSGPDTVGAIAAAPTATGIPRDEVVGNVASDEFEVPVPLTLSDPAWDGFVFASAADAATHLATYDADASGTLAAVVRTDGGFIVQKFDPGAGAQDRWSHESEIFVRTEHPDIVATLRSRDGSWTYLTEAEPTGPTYRAEGNLEPVELRDFGNIGQLRSDSSTGFSLGKPGWNRISGAGSVQQGIAEAVGEGGNKIIVNDAGRVMMYEMPEGLHAALEDMNFLLDDARVAALVDADGRLYIPNASGGLDVHRPGPDGVYRNVFQLGDITPVQPRTGTHVGDSLGMLYGTHNGRRAVQPLEVGQPFNDFGYASPADIEAWMASNVPNTNLPIVVLEEPDGRFVAYEAVGTGGVTNGADVPHVWLEIDHPKLASVYSTHADGVYRTVRDELPVGALMLGSEVASATSLNNGTEVAIADYAGSNDEPLTLGARRGNAKTGYASAEAALGAARSLGLDEFAVVPTGSGAFHVHAVFGALDRNRELRRVQVPDGVGRDALLVLDGRIHGVAGNEWVRVTGT